VIPVRPGLPRLSRTDLWIGGGTLLCRSPGTRRQCAPGRGKNAGDAGNRGTRDEVAMALPERRDGAVDDRRRRGLHNERLTIREREEPSGKLEVPRHPFIGLGELRGIAGCVPGQPPCHSAGSAWSAGCHHPVTTPPLGGARGL